MTSSPMVRSAVRTAPAPRARTLSALCGVAVLGVLLLLSGCERNESVQRGYRGSSMFQIYAPASVEAIQVLNQIPEPEAAEPPDPEAPAIKDVFENVQVLNDLTVLEFSRLMQAMSTWVAPEEGCSFCHNQENLASDEKYTKVVARRMLQMTRDINTQWKSHVAGTGVTCWTCHRGQAVPSGDWFAHPGASDRVGRLGQSTGQNKAGMSTVGNSSLPYDPLSSYLVTGDEVRVQGDSALANGNRQSIKQAESTYGLMIYLSQSLGVNCTYCHNTRALGRWDQSSPPRVTAWHGIRMVRELNTAYLIPLKPQFPPHRLSIEGDGPKVGCATCHKGSYKPLLGVSMLGDYPELAGVFPDRSLPAADGASAPMPPSAGVSLNVSR